MKHQNIHIISNAPVTDWRNLPGNSWYRRYAYVPEMNDAVCL